jgi:hypothetical protein
LGAKSDGITGDELLNFINDEKTVRPDGTKGLGSSPICAAFQLRIRQTPAM